MRLNKTKPYSTLLILIILFGIALRAEDLRYYYENPNMGLYNGEPLLAEFDGYFYLRQARALAEGNYTRIDPQRNAPYGLPRENPPSPLSLLVAYFKVASWYTLPYSWIGVMLPAILGSLIALPMYGIGLLISGRSMAFMGAFLSVISFPYIMRSNIGWLDNDCLNVTILLSICYFILSFFQTRKLKPFLFAVLFFVFWCWWWENPLVRMWYFLLPGQESIWPNVIPTISELQKPDFLKISGLWHDSVLFLIVTLIGICLMIWEKPRECLIFVPFLFLSFLGFHQQQRWLLYFTPLVSFGLAYLFAWVWNYENK